MLLMNLKKTIRWPLVNVLNVETVRLSIGFQESLVNTQGLEQKEL